MSVDLVRSLSRQLTNDANAVRTLDQYLSGSQPLAFLDPKVRAATAGRLQNLNINYARVAVSEIEDRLDVEGFRVLGDDEPISRLWRWWNANGLTHDASPCHVDALAHGKAYGIAWYGDDPEVPSLTVESAREVTVQYAPGNRRDADGNRLVVAALKEWREDASTVRSVLYLPDRIERYVTDSRGPRLDADIVPNDLGVVPVVPFVNRPRTGLEGESELTDLIPIIDAIGKLGTDLLVSAEYHAMPRRWATGLSLPPAANEAEMDRAREQVRQQWSAAEAGRVWLERNEGARFGQFSEATLDNFINAIKLLTEQLAALAALPPHAVGVNTANPASADAIRSSEARLVQRVKRKQRQFGSSWRQLMRYGDRIVTGDWNPDLASLETIWRDPETPTVAQKADAGVKLLQAQAITKRQLREDMGYTPVQIERMEAEERSAALGTVGVQIDEAERLIRERGLSRPAAYAAVGLLQAAGLMSSDTA